jgi:predicted metal-binding membrane protein
LRTGESTQLSGTAGLTLGGRTALAVSLLGAALVAWIVTVQRMEGMDAGPGTDFGAFGWFMGIWVTMMAAMMLPSAAPAVLAFAGARGGEAPWVFVVGYLLAWTGFGIVAYAVYRALRASAPTFLAWDEQGPWVAGGALVAAGLYQLTPVKNRCLRHCRSPLGSLHRGRAGPVGAVGLGLRHGGYCIGCCAGLMLVLFTLGVMSLVWMAVVAVAILVEKALPRGESFARGLGVVLVGLGIWVGASPGSVPGLTEPTRMEMDMKMRMEQ